MVGKTNVMNMNSMQTPESENSPQFGKYDLIAELAQCFPNDNASTVVGIGDDASVMDADGNQTVAVTKLFVEDVHFDLTYVPLKHLGYKVVTVAVTDILGMNAIPTQLTVNVAVSNRFDLKAVNELLSGIEACCETAHVDVVGLDYIRQMKRDLPPLVFQTSILSKRIERLRDGFYPNFRENIHTYINNNNTPLQDMGLGNLEAGTDYGCLLDGDVDLKAPIAIAFDFNANINWMVCGQRDGMRLKVIKSFYVKYERKLRELVDDFCHYYRAHISKEVVFYYDTTALGSNYAVSDKDFKAIIVEQFNKHGWYVEEHFIGKPLKHTEKYTMIDQGFTGAAGLLPVFNKENNEALLIAISMAEVRITAGQGWHKHKGGEKLMETEDDLLEHRTDGTDAFDTLYIGNCTDPYNIGLMGIGSAM